MRLRVQTTTFSISNVYVENPPMPEALSSFLISVGVIVGMALVIPCIESFVKLLRRAAPRRGTATGAEPVEAYSRKPA